MKKIIYSIIIPTLAALAVSGCSEEQTLPVGDGTIYLSTRINSNTKVENRAETEAELAATTKLWISSTEGVVRKYDGMEQVPATGVKLLSGDYTIEAWAGTLEYASFTSRWFTGSESVTIGAGDRTSVEVVCKIANVVASVNYTPEVQELLSDYTLTIGHKGGSLTFEGADTRKGYYMMPEGVTALDWTLTATADGREFTKTGVITDVKPAHEYVLNVLSSKVDSEEGGAFLEIVVDERMEEVADEIVIATPPAIIGFGFDIASPVAGESGTIGPKSVYVSACVDITSVQLSGLEGFEDIDLCKATPDVLAEASAKGVSHKVEDVDGGQMIKITFSEVYTNALANRDEPYIVTIKATDAGGKSTTGTLRFKVSAAPVITNTVRPETVSYNSLTLEAQVAADNVTAAGFNYRTVGEADWHYVAGTPASRSTFAKGSVYRAVIEGLPYDSSIEYQAVSGTEGNLDFTGSDICRVALKPTPQLPNSGMEEWCTVNEKTQMGNKDIPLPTADYSIRTWDCGNHGSMSMDKAVTTGSSEKKHSGSMSAKLATQFAGLGGSIGKLAAGNVVFGHYLKTDGMDGIFGFGNPFDFGGLKPTALKVWIHYTPVAVTHESKNANSVLKKGDMDQGHIFVALFDGPDNVDADYAGQVGFVVRTKDAKRLFNKEESNVIAYGEKILTEATPGSDMVELTIPIEYYSSKAGSVPTYIAVVATASKEGDYYAGGNGTVLYVDDFRLVY